ncbi:MAG: 5-methyltetrahydropteroyltriglutamate--homocysteine S-methyltransferase, partial [Chitinivorax sp.]
MFDVSDAQGSVCAESRTAPARSACCIWARRACTALDRLSLLPALLQAYSRLLTRLTAAGIEWVQIDEPILALELTPDWLDAIQHAYQTLGPQARLLLTTYFDDVSEHAARLCALPVAGIHLDLVRVPRQLATFAAIWPQDKVLSAGVIDGRNIWRADLDALQTTLQPLKQQLGERLWLASSCSLQHVPVDLGAETRLDPEIKSWLAFAVQKLGELRLLRDALDAPDSVADELALQRAAIQSRRQSQRVHSPLVQQRLTAIKPGDAARHAPYPQRAQLQQQRFALPLLPTTSIGSFPQTAAIRQQRAAFKRGELGSMAYLQAMRDEIELAVRKQEQLGLDVLVHGEAERNDMVEYFGELLWGYAFTGNGWVQSYGSRCVKPPVIYGDVYRPEAMTVDWTRYAQSLTKKPMKGMLTGPVTMLQWSFVRD